MRGRGHRGALGNFPPALLDVRIPRSTAGKLGHLLLFFLLEQHHEPPTESARHIPTVLISFKTTRSPSGGHGEARTGLRLIGLGSNAINRRRPISAKVDGHTKASLKPEIKIEAVFAVGELMAFLHWQHPANEP